MYSWSDTLIECPKCKCWLNELMTMANQEDGTIVISVNCSECTSELAYINQVTLFDACKVRDNLKVNMKKSIDDFNEDLEIEMGMYYYRYINRRMV